MTGVGHPVETVRILGGSLGSMLPALHPSPDAWLVPDVTAPGGDFTGKGQTIVVVDTGVLIEHPTLRNRVSRCLDLTGEGNEDQHGHGTSVAAIAAAVATGADVISVKAIGRTGVADIALLVAGILKAGELLPDGGQINVSAGRSDPTCTGGCPLCRATAQVQSIPGVILVGASGNTAEPTYCPAREGIAVETPDQWDAIGDVVVAPPRWRLVRSSTPR